MYVLCCAVRIRCMPCVDAVCVRCMSYVVQFASDICRVLCNLRQMYVVGCTVCVRCMLCVVQFASDVWCVLYSLRQMYVVCFAVCVRCMLCVVRFACCVVCIRCRMLCSLRQPGQPNPSVRSPRTGKPSSQILAERQIQQSDPLRQTNTSVRCARTVKSVSQVPSERCCRRVRQLPHNVHDHYTYK